MPTENDFYHPHVPRHEPQRDPPEGGRPLREERPARRDDALEVPSPKSPARAPY